MPVVEAKRTLVKSPPELWAELSNPGALARHLEDFGDIRITRVEPETVVEWEGDLASGRVELDASGWGTKVTLSAELAEAEPGPEAVVPEPEAVAVEPALVAPAVEAPAPAPEPVAVAEAPAPERAGWWSRMVRKWRREPEAAIAEPVLVEEPAPPLVEEPVVEEPVVAEPVAEAEPVADSLPIPAQLEAEEILKSVLEALGAAHHRPFSRA
jgi:hypothetical protein